MKYKILVALTLLLPISSYFIYSAITGQTYDAEIHNSVSYEFLQYNEGYIIYDTNDSYTGYMIPYNESYGLYIELGDIVKIDREYYTVHEGQFVNLDDIPPTTEKSSNITVSIASLVALGIGALIIGGRMDILKSHPRASAMVSLIVITAILWGLNTIITDMYTVFVVLTFSWGAYLIEHSVHEGLLTQEQADKKESDVLRKLKEFINE